MLFVSVPFALLVDSYYFFSSILLFSSLGIIVGSIRNYGVTLLRKADYSTFTVTGAIVLISIAWWFTKSIKNIGISL